MIVWPATDPGPQMMNKTKVVMKVCEMFFEDPEDIFQLKFENAKSSW